MNKYLKFTVIFLAVLILILFSITIVSIIHKYNDRDHKIVEKIKINPELNNDFLILSFQIHRKKLYLNLESKSSKSKLIKIYSLNNGTELGEIILKD
tara:strand:+ start:3187 stop:3477 length:291 start_codon:yes stop_codon:yes gene_type:complete